MNISALTVSKEEAEQEYAAYLEATKTRKERYLDDLKKVYHAIKNGMKVIDVYAVMKEHGVNEHSQPKLAIAVAGNRSCTFVKQSSGAGLFNTSEVIDSQAIQLPGNTFPDWPRFTAVEDQAAGLNTAQPRTWSTGQIKEPVLETPMPIVPAHLLPEGKLSRFYILWEVNEWTATPTRPARPAEDPFLLRRINANMFVVIAEWDLSPIEQAISKSLS